MTFVADTSGAEAYDRWFDGSWGKYAFGIEKQALLKAAREIAGSRAFDVGSGTGRFTAQLVSDGALAFAVDRDPSMLALAVRRPHSSSALADAGALPFAGASFDIAFAVTVCEFVDNVEQVFSELARVTKPGGRFVVGSLNPRSPWGFFNRERFRQAPWASARFLERRELITLGRVTTYLTPHVMPMRMTSRAMRKRRRLPREMSHAT
jgi:ubiquinone/menaquinone biosynthesis C-methylase UbiE